MMRNTTPGVPRLGIPKYDWWNEALHGVARAGDATVFPQAIGLAAMWDVPLMGRIAGTIGVEARAKFNAFARSGGAGQIFHGLTFWSPNINIFRDPRWGRGQETYGEDPFLTARTGVAFVRGLQGDDPRYLQAAACAKHFAVHSGPEPLRHIFDARPPDADLYETYLPAFEALVREGRVEAVMTAYNSLNGRPCSINPLLYTLLAKWGFNGHVTSDCGSIEDLAKSYKLANDEAEAEALAMKAGLNVRCGWEATALPEAVKRGLLSEAELDYRLAALLRTMFRLGFFDPAGDVPFNRIAPAENNTPAHAALALTAAHESMVLLKNDGLLPLDPTKLKRVAVIGPNAASHNVLLGNYHGRATAPVSVLEGIKAALGPAVEVVYAAGCDYARLPPGVRPVPRTGLGFGENTGLMGDYFNNASLANEPVAQHRDRPVSFDWSKDKLPDGVTAAKISVRWQGTLLTALAGEYHLVVKASGGVRLMLNGETLIDDWTPGEKTREAVRTLPGSVELPIKLEYFQGDAPAKVSLEWSIPPADSGMAAAVAAAQKADVVIFVGGISAQLEGEEMEVDYDGFKGGDRTKIELPAVQEELLQALQATGKPVVFVDLSGSALALPWEDEHLPAIVQAWYPGQAAGTAVADVLLGNYNPAGRLPVTFYRATADLPAFEDYNMAGRTYRYFGGKALYPFGYGLSYTRFAYTNLRVVPGKDSSFDVTVDVTNTGGRDGDEVVQLYVTPPAASHPREREALGGFSRVPLARGETKTVTLNVPATALRRWSPEKNDYVIPTGEWTVRAGASSADIRQTALVRME